MRQTGLTARDLRILDPSLSYPSAILGRQRAIVINLKHIKAIIAAQEVIFLNFREPSVIPSSEELERRILLHYRAIKAQLVHVLPNFLRRSDKKLYVAFPQGGIADGNGDDSNGKNLHGTITPESRTSSPPDFGRGVSPSEEIHEENKADGEQGHENRDGSKVLPFEFVALEARLEVVCSSLANEAKALEQEAYPAIDKLFSKINTLNLERVRYIKSRLVEATKRVQQVRDVLEHLLDDDEDMTETYLTDRLKNMENLSTSSTNEKDDMDPISGQCIPICGCQ